MTTEHRPGPFLSYLLELTHGRVVRDSVAYGPDPELVPRNAFHWKIEHDARGTVVVSALAARRPVAIAVARWSNGLRDTRQADPRTPNEYQWAIVGQSLASELARHAAMGDSPRSPRQVSVNDQFLLEPRNDLAHDGPPLDVEELERLLAARRRPTDERSPGAALVIAGGLSAALAIAGVVYMVQRDPSSKVEPSRAVRAPDPTPAQPTPTPALPAPPPTPSERVADAASFTEALEVARPTFGDGDDPLTGGAALLAGYRAVRWSDVEVDPETTVARIEKDAAAERGKRLCTSGRIQRIEARDLDGRKVFVGQLLTDEGDLVAFLAVGSTGDLLKRDQGRLCGVAVGRLAGTPFMLGLFDLPENRKPVVEQ